MSESQTKFKKKTFRKFDAKTFNPEKFSRKY